MKRVITMVALAVIAITGTAQAQDFIYGWSISSSDTDPNVNTGAPVGGAPHSLYLWLECTMGSGLSAGWSAMECDIEFTTYSILGFSGMNGVLNAGSSTALQLAATGCPPGPFLAGSINVFDAAGVGGTLCMVPSSGPFNWNVTVDCDPLNATAHENSVVGYSSDGSSPCVSEQLPCLVPVAAETWGGIKSLYR